MKKWQTASCVLLVAALVCASALAGCASGTAPSSSKSSAEVSVKDKGVVADAGGSSTAASAAAGGTTSAMSSATVPDALKTAVETDVSASGIDTSVAYIDLVTGSTYAFDADSRRVAASMIKLVVLAELLDEVADGKHSLSEQITVKSSDIVGGTGVLQDMGAGTTLPLSQVATYMISQSDNTAANIIIDMVGISAVNTQADALGLTQTSLNRRMMDSAAMAKGVENYMSANDAAKILQMIYGKQLVNADMSTFALETLTQQQISQGIDQGVPAGITVAHKTGTLSGVENDGAIVLASRPYVLVVMTDGGGSSTELQLIADISEAVYDNR